MCVKPVTLFFTFYSVQSALRTQRSNSQFCKIWLEVELEGGCFCNYVQVRKNKNAQLGFKLFYAIFWPISFLGSWIVLSTYLILFFIKYSEFGSNSAFNVLSTISQLKCCLISVKFLNLSCLPFPLQFCQHRAVCLQRPVQPWPLFCSCRLVKCASLSSTTYLWSHLHNCGNLDNLLLQSLIIVCSF